MKNTPWEHLFHGEFAQREQLLAGLTFSQVTAKPSSQSHSLYDELWPATLWQNIIVNRDEAIYEQVWQAGERYPRAQPTDLAQWLRLVEDFHDGQRRALAWTASPERLNAEVNPGETMADILRALAVHTAYHLGKIVALRQLLNAWIE